MVSCTWEITKEQWEDNTCINLRGERVVKDELKMFGESLCYGYGIYGTYCYEEDGKYFVKFSRGSTCD